MTIVDPSVYNDDDADAEDPQSGFPSISKLPRSLSIVLLEGALTRFHSPTRTAPDGLALPLDQNHPFFPGAPLPETALEICAGFHEFFSFAMQNFSELLSGRTGARVSRS